MKIDIFTHVLPREFIDYFSKHIQSSELHDMDRVYALAPALFDIKLRLETMGKYENYVQILVPTQPAAETFADNPQEAVKWAQIYNDAMAEIVSKYSTKFVGAVAYLPLNNIEGTLKEIDRTINKLGFKGILLDTPIYKLKIPGQPSSGHDYDDITAVDAPDFMPIYELMSRLKKPIWIHPKGEGGVPVYRGDTRGKYGLSHVLGWPMETAMAMSRLACSGILTKYPDLRFVTHHCGSGIIPALGSRMDEAFDFLRQTGVKWGRDGLDPLETKRPTEYLSSMFYADTALYGDSPGLMCGYSFFGSDNILFGTDYPYDAEQGDRYIRQTIDAVNNLPISHADKEKIFWGNAQRILNLDLLEVKNG